MHGARIDLLFADLLRRLCLRVGGDKRDRANEQAEDHTVEKVFHILPIRWFTTGGQRIYTLAVGVALRGHPFE